MAEARGAPVQAKTDDRQRERPPLRLLTSSPKRPPTSALPCRGGIAPPPAARHCPWGWARQRSMHDTLGARKEVMPWSQDGCKPRACQGVHNAWHCGNMRSTAIGSPFAAMQGLTRPRRRIRMSARNRALPAGVVFANDVAGASSTLNLAECSQYFCRTKSKCRRSSSNKSARTRQDALSTCSDQHT